jgi:hypothetical protein
MWKLPNELKDFNCMFSDIKITTDGFLDVAAPFRVEPIQVLYATSGAYAPAMRIAFYIFCLLSLRFRRKYWISGVCMGIVMSYSSVTALHAIILAWRRKKQITAPIEIVTISNTSEVTIPIWRMAWDEDCDAVLAITGTAFLIIAPMAIWSDTVQQIMAWKRTNQNSADIEIATFKMDASQQIVQRNSHLYANPREERKKRIVLIGWFVLLLAGLISAWVNEVFVDVYSVEQFRFCSVGGELPDINSASALNLFGQLSAEKSLNETLWEIFSIPEISQGQIPTCIYPSFTAPGYRQGGDMKAISSKGQWLAISDYSNSSAGWALMLTSIVLIAISFATILVVYLLQRTGHLKNSRRSSIKQERDVQDGNPLGNHNTGGRFMVLLWLGLEYGAKILALASFFIFVAWIEYTMWPFPYTERLSDIGQWGGIVTFILLLVFAAYDQWDDLVTACVRIKRRPEGS